MNNKFLPSAVLFITAFVLSNLASLAQVKAQVNTFYGDGAGENTTTDDNAAFGYQALHFNTTGGHNTATGAYALFGDTPGTGSDNTATGGYTLYFNTTGSFNTATGAFALGANSS